MQERKALHKKEISTHGNVFVMFENWRRDRPRHKSGRTCHSRALCGFTFEYCNVWAVNDEGTSGTVRRDWAVVNQVVPKNILNSASSDGQSCDRNLSRGLPIRSRDVRKASLGCYRR
jgi:hypothetical protein